MILAAGDRIGPYEIRAPLGSGGMGVVYRARDVRLERDVALKFLHPSDDSAANRTRLLREARAASALNHPNICAVYDVGEADGKAYIAMELVEGKPVGESVPDEGLDAATVVGWTRETADALAHAHARGVIHRDLKSANILCDETGRVKVLDFGLAQRTPSSAMELATRSANSLEDPGIVAGTLGWMSPELLRGARPDERSDLWALGILIYELSTARLPFRGDSSFDLASRVMNDPPPPLPARMPPALHQIALKLLQKDPADRYQSAAEVRAALDIIARGDAVPAPSGTREPRSAASSQRRSLVIGVSVLVVMTAAAWWLWRLASTSPLSLSDQKLVSTAANSQSSPALSTDGRMVAFVAPDDRGVPQIWIQDLAHAEPRAITGGEAAAARPRWSTAGEIVYARRGLGIWVVPSLGGTPRRIVDVGTNPNLSADGKWLTYERGHRIWIAGADGSGPRQLDHVPEKYYTVPAAPAFSPDARFVVYFRPEAGPNGDFWIAPVDGSEKPRKLTNDLREGGAPLWMPNDWIVFSSARAGSRTLWQVPARGGTPVALTTGAGDDDEPELSRDGTRLLYTNVRNSWGLMVGDAAGGQDRELLERRSAVLFPQFSPDGTRIVFFGRSDKAVAIFTVGIDGTGLTQLTHGTELNHMPRWSADGNAVYFYQISPEPSFRRVPAVGGASEAFLPLNWETENFPQFDPSGRFLSYTKARTVDAGQGAGPPRQTTIRDLRTGAERVLPGPALEYARWSRDGRFLLGWRPDRGVVTCAVDGSSCREITEGRWPVWSGDGSRIYFLRGGASTVTGRYELWSVNVDGSDTRKLRSIGPFTAIDIFFDVSPRDLMVWGEYREGRREIWAARVE